MRLATIQATQVSREEGTRTTIPMVDCDDLIKTNGEKFRNFDLRDIQKKYENGFLCPNTTEMYLQGSFESEYFSYIQISILGCGLPEE